MPRTKASTIKTTNKKPNKKKNQKTVNNKKKSSPCKPNINKNQIYFHPKNYKVKAIIIH